MRHSESLSNIAAALSKFQAEVKQPKKDKDNPFFKSKYVPLESVIAAIAPTMETHGLSYFQSTGTDGENAFVTTLLMHSSGEFIESDPVYAPALQSTRGGGKEFNAQGVGSSITYLRRYSLTAALGVASEEDDDGNDVSGKTNNQVQSNNQDPLPTKDQVQEFRDALYKFVYLGNEGTEEERLKKTLESLASQLKIDTSNIDKMTLKDISASKSLINRWIKQKEAKQHAE